MPTVLIVDDDVDVAEALGELVRVLGFSLLLAYDGKQGLEVFLAQQPDAVISDITMPVMDGLELARAIRQADAGVKTPLVALTGNNNQADVELSKAAGFSIHLGKPVDFRKLEAFLNVSVVMEASPALSTANAKARHAN